MDATHTIQAASQPDPRSRIDSAPAVTAETTQPAEPLYADIPGEGRVLLGPVLAHPEREYTAGEIPPSLSRLLDHGDRYEAQLIRLIYDAKNLAESRIAHMFRTATCNECLAAASAASGTIAHFADCKTGRVLAAIAELAKASEPISIRKETAPAEGSATGPVEAESSIGYHPEPWSYRYDKVLGNASFYDRDGVYIGLMVSHSDDAKFVFDRIVDCVNSCAPEGGRQ